MTERRIGDVTIECAQGDITRQSDMEAIVNAANAQLMTGGGVAGAIHRAAGAGLAAECRPLAPIRPGQVVITGAHRLPNRRVIHCLGPIYGQDEPAEDLLASCYREALRLAEQDGLPSVAFPAISTGAFGYPMEAAARVAFTTLIAEAPHLRRVNRIRLVLHTRHDLELHERILGELVDRFQKQLAAINAVPWMLATGEDCRYECTVGRRLDLGTRLMQRYVDRVIALTTDAAVRDVLLRTFNLLRPPSKLFQPAIVAKVARQAITRTNLLPRLKRHAVMEGERVTS
jgi:O-acetyl-ADP-ribose deacetylase